ncbi:hypothetical protein T07_11685 [Trichinella nelsoni]|uniref:Uncharacterized protein n=1 Tax=Trichinella nelsoni TaxID=6336 RepID=A0A0V0REW5_9BILA|nr:hypothetical protein T07_11685 [Trichinella nelsoni]
MHHDDAVNEDQEGKPDIIKLMKQRKSENADNTKQNKNEKVKKGRHVANRALSETEQEKTNERYINPPQLQHGFKILNMIATPPLTYHCTTPAQD